MPPSLRPGFCAAVALSLDAAASFVLGCRDAKQGEPPGGPGSREGCQKTQATQKHRPERACRCVQLLDLGTPVWSQGGMMHESHTPLGYHGGPKESLVMRSVKFSTAFLAFLPSFCSKAVCTGLSLCLPSWLRPEQENVGAGQASWAFC